MYLALVSWYFGDGDWLSVFAGAFQNQHTHELTRLEAAPAKNKVSGTLIRRHPPPVH
jgi:hypothetical protein